MSVESYTTEIQSNYQSYLNRYPDEGMISSGDSESEYPFQSGVLTKRRNYISKNISELELDCLVCFNDTIPSIRKLSVNDLISLSLELLDILKIQITHDHLKLWEETAYVLSTLDSDETPVNDDVARNIEILTRLGLADISGNSAPFWEWSDNGHTSNILKNSHIIASYMAYPTLEGLVKSLCSDNINMDGTIKSGTIVTNLGGPDYQAGTNNDEVHALRDILYHLEESGDVVLSQRMEKARENIADFYDISSDEVYGFIYDRRNTTLHGEAEAGADFGIALTLVSLLVWDKIQRLI